jgi:hypothetical protein
MFCSVSLTMRMRSTVGLKSNPQAVPLNVNWPLAPTCEVAPVVVLTM